MATPTLSSALQKHAAFFDGNRNGKITVRETYDGLRKLGMQAPTAAGAAVAINAGLAPLTSRGLDKFDFTIDIANIKAGKHSGDSGLFDQDGHFDRKAFDAKFAKASGDGKTLTEAELLSLRSAPTDVAGKVASNAEFPLLFKLAKDGTAQRGGKTVPVMSKAALLSFYDGTLFPRLAAQRAK
ncbi:MAG: caleosin family protein [Myxococcaceae bacterium]|nr:caleosin family protein [Myxococcaceae bacterium]